MNDHLYVCYGYQICLCSSIFQLDFETVPTVLCFLFYANAVFSQRGEECGSFNQVVKCYLKIILCFYLTGTFNISI